MEERARSGLGTKRDEVFPSWRHDDLLLSRSACTFNFLSQDALYYTRLYLPWDLYLRPSDKLHGPLRYDGIRLGGSVLDRGILASKLLRLPLVGLGVLEREATGSLVGTCPLADAALVTAEHDAPQPKRREGAIPNRPQEIACLFSRAILDISGYSVCAMVDGGDEDGGIRER